MISKNITTKVLGNSGKNLGEVRRKGGSTFKYP